MPKMLYALHNDYASIPTNVFRK